MGEECLGCFIEKGAGENAVLEGRNFAGEGSGRFHAGGAAGDEAQVRDADGAKFVLAELVERNGGDWREEVLEGSGDGNFVENNIRDALSGGGFEFEDSACIIGQESVGHRGFVGVGEKFCDLAGGENGDLGEFASDDLLDGEADILAKRAVGVDHAAALGNGKNQRAEFGGAMWIEAH